MNYLIAIIVSIIIALGLRLPLLPSKPRRFSFDVSAIFPTPIIAIGILAILFALDYFWIWDGMALAIIVAIFSALFCKFLFDYVFPKPPEDEHDIEEIGEIR